MIKDENLIKIKEIINTVLPDSDVILFGSRGKENFDKYSDYDILVIVKQNLDIREKYQYESKIRSQLAKAGIDIDIIVKTEDDIPIHLKRIDSVIKEAIETGVLI